jgi:hypothetical protein
MVIRLLTRLRPATADPPAAGVVKMRIDLTQRQR